MQQASSRASAFQQSIQAVALDLTKTVSAGSTTETVAASSLWLQVISMSPPDASITSEPSACGVTYSGDLSAAPAATRPIRDPTRTGLNAPPSSAKPTASAPTKADPEFCLSDSEHSVSPPLIDCISSSEDEGAPSTTTLQPQRERTHEAKAGRSAITKLVATSAGAKGKKSLSVAFTDGFSHEKLSSQTPAKGQAMKPAAVGEATPMLSYSLFSPPVSPTAQPKEELDVNREKVRARKSSQPSTRGKLTLVTKKPLSGSTVSSAASNAIPSRDLNSDASISEATAISTVPTTTSLAATATAISDIRLLPSSKDERTARNDEERARERMASAFTLNDVQHLSDWADYLRHIPSSSNDSSPVGTMLRGVDSSHGEAICAGFVAKLLCQGKEAKFVSQVVASILKYFQIYNWNASIWWSHARVQSLLKRVSPDLTLPEYNAAAKRKMTNLKAAASLKMILDATDQFYARHDGSSALGLKQRCIYRALLFLASFGLRPSQVNKARAGDRDHAMRGKDVIVTGQLINHSLLQHLETCPQKDEDANVGSCAYCSPTKSYISQPHTNELTLSKQWRPLEYLFIIGTSKTTKVSRVDSAGCYVWDLESSAQLLRYANEHHVESHPEPDREYWQGITSYNATLVERECSRYNRDDMTKMLKDIASSAGEDPDSYSLKSFRVGRATSTVLATVQRSGTNNMTNSPYETIPTIDPKSLTATQLGLTGTGLWSASSKVPSNTYNRTPGRAATATAPTATTASTPPLVPAGMVTRRARLALQADVVTGSTPDDGPKPKKARKGYSEETKK